MALLSRIKNLAKPNNNFLNIIKRHYFQINSPRLPILINTNHSFHSPISPNNQILDYRRGGFLNSSVRFFAAPAKFLKKKEEAEKLKRPRLNDEIVADFIRLVTDEGHSVVSRRVALQRAKELQFDLVEVDPDAKPPVCRLMDYKKEMYKKQVKSKEKAKLKPGESLRASTSKEVRFSAKAELKDIKMKADNVKRLMERGYRVKCSALAGEGRDLNKLLSQISDLIKDVAFVELGPKFEERQAFLIVRHIKFGPSKKGNKGSKGLTPTSTNGEIQKESITSSDGLLDCEEQIDAEESDMDSDNDESDVHLDEVKPTLQGRGGRSSSINNQRGPNFLPNARPTLQPENRYTKKVPSNDESGVPLGEVKPPLQGRGGRSSSINNVGPNFVPSVIPLQPENRYAKKVPSNASPARYPNNGTQLQSHSPGFPPVGPGQAGGEASSSRKSWPRQNENLQPCGDIPNRAQPVNNFSPHVGLPRPPTFNSNDGSKSTTFGLFSGAKAKDENINPPSSGSDGAAASNDKKWGIFSGKK